MSDSDSDTTFVLYHYTPSAVAAVIFAAIFFLASAVHVWRIIKSRSWYFSAIVVGGIMEGVGYVGRYMSHSDPKSLGPYIMQTLLLLVAPALFAAAIYVILGRIIRMLHAERFSLIRINWLTKFFVFGDVISFFLQSAGGGLMANGKDDSKRKLGQIVIIVGLVAQIIWFGGFVFVAGVFHYRMRVVPSVSEKTNWRRFMFVLYGASNMILVRSVFRVVEFAQGNDGYFVQSEKWIYMFDALLMGQVIVLFTVFHPSSYIVEHEHYAMGEREERGILGEDHVNAVSLHPYSDLRSGR